MRFVTFLQDGQAALGILNEKGTEVLDLAAAQKKRDGKVTISNDLVAEIETGEDFVRLAAQLSKWADEQADRSFVYALNGGLKLLAPIPRPRKNIFCLGKNYAAHAIEMGSADDIPKHPMVFSKTPTTVTGPFDPVLRHAEFTESLDYEAELAIVIGRKGKGIPKEEAFDYIFGYTVVNDITARDRQSRHKQYLLGKSLDTSCPMGPAVVHKSLVPDPHNLQIQSRVNGEVRQSANTEQFIFDIATMISVISAGTTLEPGDIIATGTPAGVGSGFTPPRFLQTGDVVEVEVEGVGLIRNTIVEG